MAHELPAPFCYHPAALLGSMLSAPGVAAAASRDAEPELERPSIWVRLGDRVAKLRIYAPARSAA